MLVLIGVAPAGFVVNMNATGYDIARTRDAVTHVQLYYQQHAEALPHAIALKPLVPAQKPCQVHLRNSTVTLHARWSPLTMHKRC